MDRLMRRLDLGTRGPGRINQQPTYPPPQALANSAANDELSTIYELLLAIRQRRATEALLANRAAAAAAMPTLPPPVAMRPIPRPIATPPPTTLHTRIPQSSPTGLVCVFCRNNGETEAVYTSHQLKDKLGRVTCPILRAYTCPTCGSNGDNAHTIKYCPLGPPSSTSRATTLNTAPRSLVTRRFVSV